MNTGFGSAAGNGNVGIFFDGGLQRGLSEHRLLEIRVLEMWLLHAVTHRFRERR